MKRTAYFHPAIAEELALLSPDTRIHFYSLAARDATSFLNLDRYCNYQPQGQTNVRRIFGTSYYEVTAIPKTCVAINRHAIQDCNVYLHLKIDDGSLDRAAFDEELMATTQARLAQMKTREAEVLIFFEFADLYADPVELKEANRLDIAMSQNKFYRRMMQLAYQDTLKGYRSLFNLSPMQMERAITRFDNFLESFNENLSNRMGGRVNLVVNFRDDAFFEAKSFRELTRDEMTDEMNGDGE